MAADMFQQFSLDNNRVSLLDEDPIIAEVSHDKPQSLLMLPVCGGMN